jgi:DNA-binding response OmpR family regulator
MRDDNLASMLASSYDTRPAGASSRRRGAPLAVSSRGAGSSPRSGSERSRGEAVDASRGTELPAMRPLRLAVLDRDSGFHVVLERRMADLDWQYKALGSPVRPARLVDLGFDVVVVNPVVLGPGRWRWLETLCAAPGRPAVIVCTEGAGVVERVRGLRLGVDDWVGKPCHPDELIARIEAVLRHRVGIGSKEEVPLVIGEVEINLAQRQAFADGESLDLTRREFQILELLARNPSVALRRETIFELVWLAPMPREDRSVDVVVHKIRRKLQAASPGWNYVHTVRSFGYGVAAVPFEAKPPKLTPTEGNQR